MPTIEEALHYGQQELTQLSNPRFEAQLILAHLMNVGRSYLIAFPERQVPITIFQHYQQWIKERKSGIPFAYLVGYKEFYGLTLIVTRDTLIPRDDTEILVNEALAIIPKSGNFSVLDLGTGTGAIALALKKNRPNATITAIDFNPNTLNVAKKNAQLLKLNIDFLQSNWFENLTGQTFDLIVSNPPYIDPEDEHLAGDGLLFEPKHALIAKQQGLHDLFTIIKQARSYLNPQCTLILEHGYDQAEKLQVYFQNQGYLAIKTIQDYGQNDRITKGTWSNKTL